MQFSDCLRNKQDRNCWKLLLGLGFPAAVFILSSVRFDKNYILSSESMIAGYQFVNDILKMCTVCQNCKHAKYTMHQFSILSVKLQKRHNLGACICMQYQMKILCTKQNEEILFYKAHQEVWFWLVHVECSFLLNKTNRITLGHLFIGYYFQRTEMILFNCKQLTHSFLWAVFILTSRMSDLAGRSLAWFTRTVFTIVY